MTVFDKSKPYGTCMGDQPDGRRYVQGDKVYGWDEMEIKEQRDEPIAVTADGVVIAIAQAKVYADVAATAVDGIKAITALKPAKPKPKLDMRLKKNKGK